MYIQANIQAWPRPPAWPLTSCAPSFVSACIDYVFHTVQHTGWQSMYVVVCVCAHNAGTAGGAYMRREPAAALQLACSMTGEQRVLGRWMGAAAGSKHRLFVCAWRSQAARHYWKMCVYCPDGTYLGSLTSHVINPGCSVQPWVSITPGPSSRSAPDRCRLPHSTHTPPALRPSTPANAAAARCGVIGPCPSSLALALWLFSLPATC